MSVKGQSINYVSSVTGTVQGLCVSILLESQSINYVSSVTGTVQDLCVSILLEVNKLCQFCDGYRSRPLCQYFVRG